MREEKRHNHEQTLEPDKGSAPGQPGRRSYSDKTNDCTALVRILITTKCRGALMTEDDRKEEIALAEYKEVVTQFRTLTDIRFKLLTYLPLGTVAAAVFVPATSDLLKQPDLLKQQPAIAAFAFVVTLCIATYDKRNDQHYDELVARAAELERELKIEHGSFSDRPRDWLKYGFVSVQHRWPIGLIYAAAASLWAYLFAAALVIDHRGLGWLKFAAWAVVIACWKGLRRIEKDRSKTQKQFVKNLMRKLRGSNDAHLRGNLVELIAAQQRLLGIDKDTAANRVGYYWKDFVEFCGLHGGWVASETQKRDARAASALLSRVIDLPARWIEDVSTGRR